MYVCIQLNRLHTFVDLKHLVELRTIGLSKVHERESVHVPLTLFHGVDDELTTATISGWQVTIISKPLSFLSIQILMKNNYVRTYSITQFKNSTCQVLLLIAIVVFRVLIVFSF